MEHFCEAVGLFKRSAMLWFSHFCFEKEPPFRQLEKKGPGWGIENSYWKFLFLKDVFNIITMKIWVIIGLLIFPLLRVAAQEQAEDVYAFDLSTFSGVHQGNSYITLPFNIGNIDPIWFEANVMPDFIIRESKSARLMGVITPQIIIRMYQEESFPVRTPSYIPQITIYYAPTTKPDNERTILFGRIAHHSNGQEDDFYLPGQVVNLKSGNFSTNYLQAGAIRSRYSKKLNAWQFFSTHLEMHPKGWSAPELRNRYSPLRWQVAMSVYKNPFAKKPDRHNKSQLSVTAKASWMFGEVDNWKTFASDRLTVDITFNLHPGFFEEIGFFVNFYYGMDYYNIYFNEMLQVVRFGIMTEGLKF